MTSGLLGLTTRAQLPQEASGRRTEVEEGLDRTRSRPLRGNQRKAVAADLAEQFIGGTRSIQKLANSVGRRPSLVRRLLAEAGVRADGPECVGTDLAETVRIVHDCYQQHGSIQAVVQLTGLDRRVVRHLLRLPSDQDADASETAAMAERYRAGASLQEIAEDTGRPYNQVRAMLIAAGVTLRAPGGPARHHD